MGIEEHPLPVNKEGPLGWCFGAPLSLHQGLVPLQSLRLAGSSLAITAPAISSRIPHQAGPHRVQIDVGRDGAQGGTVGADQDALEALFPEGATPALTQIVPLAEALFEFFEELAEVSHPSPEPVAQ